MAEKSFFWTSNATGDGTSGGYTALENSEIWRDLFLAGNEASQGVIKGAGNELAVTGTASPLAVNTGAALVYGKAYRNTASVNVTVSTPSVGTTGGHVILRLDWTAQTVRLVAVRNTDGVNSTPSLTQSTSTQWEIRLASFTITTGGVIAVTDARAYAHFGTMIATAQLDSNAVTTAKITDANVTTAKLADNAVTTAKITDANVTTAKIADSAINSSKLGADSVYNTHIVDGTVGTNELANDSVDDTKAGNRVLQLYRRQGGNATHWDVFGTSTQTPGAVRMQAGALDASITAAASAQFTVTFPVAYSARPLVFVQPTQYSSNHFVADVTNISTTGFTVTVLEKTGASGTYGPVLFWHSVGSE